jgi:4-amino-4-deoxy-L-arabinose transferase-like glycosyltransferase
MRTVANTSRARWIAVALALATIAIYAVRLALLSLVHDEVVYALNALSLANTGRDLSGQFLPVSIPVIGTFFATPLNIYTTAIFLKLAPLTETVVRLPSVLIGALNVALVFLVGRKILDSTRLAALAAVILMLTPAHFIHSRLATDHIYVVAIMLGWMLALLSVEREDQRWRIAASTALLGLGLYSYLGAAITMPVFVGVTLVFLYLRGFRSPTTFVVAAAGFLVVVFPFVLWHALHPDQYGKQMQMYGLARAQAGAGIAGRIGVYWDYFSPSFLFFAGDTGLINGTRMTGVFLLPMMVLLAIGIGALLLRAASPTILLLLTAFAVSPLAATVVGERYRINRALVMLPLAALIAAAGVRALWTHRSRAARVVAAGLLIAMPIQFAMFYRDYLTAYPARSQSWFEYNIRGGMEEIIGRATIDRVPVFIAANIQWAEYYWPLYVAKHSRSDFSSTMRIVDLGSASTRAGLPEHAFVLCRKSDAGPLVDAGFTLVVSVPEPDGDSQFSVLQR